MCDTIFTVSATRMAGGKLTSIDHSAKRRHGRRRPPPSRVLAHDGALEVLFTWAFRHMVYPQIWEDPEVDMEALAITPDCDIVTIASGLAATYFPI